MITKQMSDRALEELPIFRGMTEDESQELLAFATVVPFSEGDLLLKQGEMGQAFYILLEGECEVVRKTAGGPKEPIVLAELQQPAHFGEMSFFHPAPHSATVTAKTDGVLLKLTRPDYDALVERGEVAAYKLALNAVELLSDRLRRMDEWVTDLVRSEDGTPHTSEWSFFRQKLFNSY